ncbi:MAG: YukJ family protein [Amoebophilaceae bacterium]|nr:YukJ family protein [Amoebophilaceae bacterium]
MVFIENFDHKLLSFLDKLGAEGLFALNEHTMDYRLDYLRSNLVPWQEISNLLDQHLKVGTKIYFLGEYYDDQQIRTELPHGLMLQQTYPDLPPRGMHDIHLNQGVSLNMVQSKSNGIYQDGVMFIKAADNSINAFFFMFDCQSLTT